MVPKHVTTKQFSREDLQRRVRHSLISQQNRRFRDVAPLFLIISRLLIIIVQASFGRLLFEIAMPRSS